jgi:chondroitin AC lyase
MKLNSRILPMTKRFIILVLFQLCFLRQAHAQIDTLLNRYREYLLQTLKPNATEIDYWITTLDQEGQWPDINYQDPERANWKVAKHLERVRDLATAWVSPKSRHYHNKDLVKKTGIALDHWLAKRYQNSNWWHNQIGVPRHMRDILVLIRDNLSAEQFDQGLEVLGQHRLMENGGGANLIWSADLGLHFGALAGDEKLIARCRDLVVNEIIIHHGEGIQPDHSFHQHSKRLQIYQYGKAFLWEAVRLAWQLRGTSWAFPEEKVDILSSFVLEGWQWMARGINTVPGTMDRSSSRIGELRSPDLRPLIPFISDLQPEKARAFKKMTDVQNGLGSLEGFRYYPYSDFAVFHRPGFSFFLKTISTRTLPAESFNGENLKGKLLNSGDAYLVSNGQEYFDLMPVWDWMALPGITAFGNAYGIDRRSFTGSVSDGVSGLSAMDYRLADKEQKQTLSAHKFWACHKDLVVCLISDLSGENISDNVYTAMDQCRLQGDVTVNKPGNTLSGGLHKLNKTKWIHHASFAYIPLYDVDVHIQIKEVTDSWKSINVSQPDIPVTEKIFMPVLDHDGGLQEQSAGYVLAPAPSPVHAEKIAVRPDWKILQNDNECQAVLFNDGTIMAAFFSPSALKNKHYQLAVDKPCLVLIRDKKMFISNPLHSEATINIKWNEKTTDVTVPPDGTTKEVTMRVHPGK